MELHFSSTQDKKIDHLKKQKSQNDYCDIFRSILATFSQKVGKIVKICYFGALWVNQKMRRFTYHPRNTTNILKVTGDQFYEDGSNISL